MRLFLKDMVLPLKAVNLFLVYIFALYSPGSPAKLLAIRIF